MKSTQKAQMKQIADTIKMLDPDGDGRFTVPSNVSAYEALLEHLPNMTYGSLTAIVSLGRKFGVFETKRDGLYVREIRVTNAPPLDQRGRRRSRRIVTVAPGNASKTLEAQRLNHRIDRIDGLIVGLEEVADAAFKQLEELYDIIGDLKTNIALAKSAAGRS